ncbi:MAG: hypothetical protein A3H28_07415 [Acidobacteria bacterium RIFCSPLOWO2_02_FULL_61_28]|nr:MAG: hypothetical protein A3H28_07415 [Acidobacteria bacterium RIFCSPLOWO2_02_FULL_61_28]
MRFRNSSYWIRLAVLFLLITGTAALAQRATLRPAEPIVLPGISDSNSPVHWKDGKFVMFQSLGLPLMAQGTRQSETLKAKGVLLKNISRVPLWIESTWVDEDGTLYAWYHHERWACNPLAVPAIGALVSTDGGFSFSDLGIILESGYSADCNARNGIFAGGHGDFTVLLDRWRQHFYFYFTNYSGPLSSQGVAVARMAFNDRRRPVGQVWKFQDNNWGEPGLGGRVTAILPARVSWNRSETDSFWGPALHWNTFLNQYVMLLSRSCCAPKWPQEGVYVSFNPDLSNPHSWSPPTKLLDGKDAQWYPQVVGIGPPLTDKIAGRIARFYMAGESRWFIVFDY